MLARKLPNGALISSASRLRPTDDQEAGRAGPVDFVFGGDAARGAFQTCLMEHDVGLLGAGETLIVTNQDAPDWLLP